MLDIHDHRKIASQLDLFHMQPEAPGMVYWHPRGFALLRALEDAIRREMRRQGFAEVRSPQLLRQAVWEASGHWEHFREGMFVVDEDRRAALKPVSCPAHLHIAKSSRISYRELPLRLGEIGLVHRNEKSGNLHGLFRLRQFSQDDGHILCASHQVADEVERFLSRLRDFYAVFDLHDLEIAFSSRPDASLGSDAAWAEAEALLREAAARADVELIEQPGEGAFYGPKLEIALGDRLGRRWQCGTIQLDLMMPERFDVAYVDERDARLRPALLHRALLGSLERFLGIVLESCDGHLPAWLAPEQILVIPVRPEQREAADLLRERLAGAGLRVRVEARNESVGRRALVARELRIPIVVVLGARELAAGSVSVRHGDAQQDVANEQVIPMLEALCRPPL